MSYISAEISTNDRGYADGADVYVYENIDKKIVVKKYPGIFEFYEQNEFGTYESIYGDKLIKHEFDDLKSFRDARKEKLSKGIKLYESDISADTKVLSKYYYNQPSPELNVLLYDIEVFYRSRSFDDNTTIKARYNNIEKEIKLGDLRSLSKNDQSNFEVYDKKYKKWFKYLHSDYTYEGPTGFSSPENPYAPINAIAIHKSWTGESIVMAVPPPGFDMNDLDHSLEELTELRFYKNEKDLLIDFILEFQDAAIISGYNGSFFDDPYVAKRVEMVLGNHYFKKLSFKHAPTPKYNEIFVKGRKQMQVKLGGRVQLDYLELFKKFEVADRASFKLESVAEDYLPHLPKLSYSGTLEQLYKNNFNMFLRYNVRDTEILVGLENKLNYIKVANEMVHSSTNQFKHIFGTVRMVDNAIVNYVHYEMNKIVPDRWDTKDGSIQGAYVLYPQKGMHKFICSIDINSLYPSAIRAINISPETIRGQFTRNIRDWLCFYEQKDELLTLRFEDGSTETKSMTEWTEYLLDHKWCVSGYGTVYTQEFKGVIPSLLEEWYNLRKVYQKEKKKYEQQLVDLKSTKDYDKQLANELYEKVAHYDRLQFIYKIKLNSTYGCLSNYNFRFFRLESGESTTGTGRMILKHQCRKVNELIEGDYWIDFPLYESTKKIDELNKAHAAKQEDEDVFVDFVHNEAKSLKEMIEVGRQEHYHADQLTYDIAFNGPKFNNKFQSNTILYGDSVTGDSIVVFDNKEDTIENWFETFGKKYGIEQMPNDIQLVILPYEEYSTQAVLKYGDDYVGGFDYVKLLYRHKTYKQIYQVTTSSGKQIKVTEDHSIMILKDGKLVECKPHDLTKDDILFEIDENYHLERVSPTKIKFINNDNQWVYDISMKNKNLPYFFANNILVKNTDSTYFSLDISSVDQAVKVADYITEQVNGSYDEFMRSAFLCQPGFDNLIRCAREIVSDSGIFVEKKRYVVHVNDQEGKKVDKMKIMGLDLKKTTLPKPIQKKLTEYISRLLKHEDWISISKDVVAYKEELLNFENIHEVGLPKGVNNIEDYTIKYQLDGEKTRLPGNVAAAIFYNECLKQYGDRESIEIESGMKIKTYYLSKQFGRFSSIALPTDQEIVPQWFIDNIIPVIDKEKQLSRLIDNPLNNILKSVNLPTPTAQLVHAHDVFVF